MEFDNLVQYFWDVTRGGGGNGERRSRNPTPPRRSREPPRRRSLSPNDARHRIESNIEVRRYKEEDVYVGPKCFGPRIRQTKFPVDFGIAKHIQPYDGAARPDTWLQDFFSGLLHRQRRKQPGCSLISPTDAAEDGSIMAQ